LKNILKTYKKQITASVTNLQKYYQLMSQYW